MPTGPFTPLSGSRSSRSSTRSKATWVSSAAEANRRALEKKVVGGYELNGPLAGAMLVCATEMNRREEMDRFAEAF